MFELSNVFSSMATIMNYIFYSAFAFVMYIVISFNSVLYVKYLRDKISKHRLLSNMDALLLRMLFIYSLIPGLNVMIFTTALLHMALFVVVSGFTSIKEDWNELKGGL